MKWRFCEMIMSVILRSRATKNPNEKRFFASLRMTQKCCFAIVPRLIFLVFVLENNSRAYAEDIRDIKPPLDLPADYFFWFVLLGILILGGIVFLVRFFILRSKQPPKISVPIKLPWEVALERLTALQSQDLPQKGQTKEYYSQLSDIIRRYMEDRFHIRAPEMTTQEFLWSLNDARELTLSSSPTLIQGVEGLTDLHKSLLKDFLNSCDLVKFARYGSTLREMDGSFRFAVKLIEETKLSEYLQN